MGRIRIRCGHTKAKVEYQEAKESLPAGQFVGELKARTEQVINDKAKPYIYTSPQKPDIQAIDLFFESTFWVLLFTLNDAGRGLTIWHISKGDNGHKLAAPHLGSNEGILDLVWTRISEVNRLD